MSAFCPISRATLYCYVGLLLSIAKNSFSQDTRFCYLIYIGMAELSNEFFHTVIIGAGASGLMCAGSFTRRKLLLEHNPAPGTKVAVSGGGKCNFSNRFLSAACYQSAQKHFCKSALAAFKTQDFIALLTENAIPWEERSHGQLFAKNAQDVVHMLVTRAKQANTVLKTRVQVLDISKEKDLFTLHTSAGTITAQNVVLASGGPSYPQLGASNFAAVMAKKLGLNIIDQRPALAGLTFNKALKEQFRPLAGNALPVHIKTNKFDYRENLLFTHEGVSGPAVLQASLFWQEGQPVRINFLPDTDVLQLLEERKNSKKSISAELADLLPVKITKTLLGPLERDLANATKKEMMSAAARINAFEFIPAQTSGYCKAEATAGGIDVRELSPATLECKKIPGLFIVGEAADVTGMVGGYNLQWAWSSGFAAAQCLQKRA